MSRNSRLYLVLACLSSTLILNHVFGDSDSVLSKGVQLFGQPLKPEHAVFRLSDTYVIWLLVDTSGDLFKVVVGPKSYYSTEFPNATKSSAAEFLSETEYEQTIKKISELKNIGQLQNRHTHAIHTAIGPLNTDHFERAFVDRVVSPDNDENVCRFDVFFLRDIPGSPEQIIATQPSMVCLADVWYYLSSEDTARIKLGTWQTLRIAGPTIRGRAGCFRTTVVRDADGFTIEQPQTELIVESTPYKVRELIGRVSLAESPIEAANVEFLRVGSKNVIRTKTDSSGAFRMPGMHEGTYKFKVTKDGFKALSGTIILDRRASADAKLLFELHLGT